MSQKPLFNQFFCEIFGYRRERQGYSQQIKQYHPDENQYDAQDFVDISLEEIRQDRDIHQRFYDKDAKNNIRETPSKGIEDAG